MPAAARAASPSCCSRACRGAASWRSTSRPRCSPQARERLARFGEQVTYVQADLGQAAAARATGRCRPVDGDLPLGAGPRRALRESRLRAPAGRLARGAMRRVRQRRDDAAGRRARSIRASRRQHNFQTPEATAARLEAIRLRPNRGVAVGGARPGSIQAPRSRPSSRRSACARSSTSCRPASASRSSRRSRRECPNRCWTTSDSTSRPAGGEIARMPELRDVPARLARLGLGAGRRPAIPSSAAGRASRSASRSTSSRRSPASR